MNVSWIVWQSSRELLKLYEVMCFLKKQTRGQLLLHNHTFIVHYGSSCLQRQTFTLQNDPSASTVPSLTRLKGTVKCRVEMWQMASGAEWQLISVRTPATVRSSWLAAAESPASAASSQRPLSLTSTLSGRHTGSSQWQIPSSLLSNSSLGDGWDDIRYLSA